MSVEDLAGLGKAAEKLIGEVSRAIGSVFKPGSMLREGKAEATTILAIENARATASSNAEIMALETKLEKIALLSDGNEEVVARAKRRLLIQEIQGQTNIETIAEAAIPLLPTAVSEEPLNDDWRRRFFTYAADVCTEDMQQIWAKVLAGEVSAPRSYSLRSLDILRNLGSEQAELFRKLCKLAVLPGQIMFPGPNVNEDFKEFGISYEDLLSLRDCGLLHEGDTLHMNFVSDAEVKEVIFRYNGLLIKLESPSLSGKTYSILILTKAGRELIKLMDDDPNIDYLKRVAVQLAQRAITMKRGVIVETSKNGTSVIDFVDVLAVETNPRAPTSPDSVAPA